MGRVDTVQPWKGILPGEPFRIDSPSHTPKPLPFLSLKELSKNPVDSDHTNLHFPLPVTQAQISQAPWHCFLLSLG